MTTPLDQIEEKARQATPGKWQTNEPASYNTYPGVYLILGGIPNTDAEVVVINDDEAKRENLEYIALCNPALVLDWAKETRRLRGALEFYADKRNWDDGDNSSPADLDYGSRARQALKGVNP